MSSIDATVLFNDAAFSPTEGGGVAARPSIYALAPMMLFRGLIILLLIFVYFWFYPEWQPPALVLYVPVLAVLGTVLARIVRVLSIQYEVKGDKLIFREGVFMRHSGAVNIGRIQNADVYQNIVERFFGIGTVMVNTDDSTVSRIWMIGMSKPDALRAAILESSESVRKARGLFEFVRP